MFNEVRSDVFVSCVDIGGNVDHHCLNFLFIITHKNCFLVEAKYKNEM
jgi:hypothetical protein